MTLREHIREISVRETNQYWYDSMGFGRVIKELAAMAFLHNWDRTSRDSRAILLANSLMSTFGCVQDCEMDVL